MRRMKILQKAFVLMAILLSTANSYAAEKTVTVGSATGEQGSQVEVFINLNDAASTAGAAFTVNFDPTKLILSNIESSFFGTFEAQNINPTSIEVDGTTYFSPLVYYPTDVNTGTVMLAAARIDNGSGADAPIFKLVFNIANDAAVGVSPITITQSIINNTAAGYSATGDSIPMLVGIDGVGFVNHTVTAVGGSITVAEPVDSDNDTLADSWEMTHFGDLTTANASTDTDGDGYSDKLENTNGTDPKVRDASGGSGYNIYTDKQATFTGDFNGDKTLDVLMRDQTTGEITMLFANRSYTPVEVMTISEMDLVIKDIGDFNGDGKSDILLHNPSTGEAYVYLMDGATILSEGSPGISDLNYVVETTGDYNGDGRSDILWRHKVNGQLNMWFMDGTSTPSTSNPLSFSISNSAANYWQIKKSGDFDGDTKEDILAYKPSTGQAYVYLMDGTIKVSQGSPGLFSDLNYVIETIGDYNGDDKTDILWRHKVTGRIYMWFMDGAAKTSAPFVATQADRNQIIIGSQDHDSNGKTDIFWLNLTTNKMYCWLMSDNTIQFTQLIQTITDDFSGDGKSDILWRHKLTDQLRLWYINGTARTSNLSVFTVADPSLINKSGDFNGDGKGDILLYNPSTGETNVYLMNGAKILSSGTPGPFDSALYVLETTGDYDGDGKSDILLRHKTTDRTLMWFMDGTVRAKSTLSIFIADSWLIKNSGDFNGDGKGDILLHDPSTGQAYVYLMDGAAKLGQGGPGGLSGLNFAMETTGDYNGDGKTDILWRHKGNGQIYMWFMNGAIKTSSSFAFAVANIWQIKNSGDFNGDGKGDILVHNPSTGRAYIYLMNGAAKLSQGSPGAYVDLNYEIQ